MLLNEIREQLYHWEGELSFLKTEIRNEKARYKQYAADQKNSGKAAALVREVAIQAQEKLQWKISTLVTDALEALFPETYEFQIVFETKRNNTEARLLLVKQGKEIDPMAATGGGVVDVCAFALRLACLLISRPIPPKVLILDEPFKFLSRDLQPLIGDLINELSEKLGVQFLLVTHEEDLGL